MSRGSTTFHCTIPPPPALALLVEAIEDPCSLSAFATSTLSITALNNVELRPFLWGLPVVGATGPGVDPSEYGGKFPDAVRWEGITMVWGPGVRLSA